MMRRAIAWRVTLLLCVATTAAHAQASVGASRLDIATLLPQPPAPGSDDERRELAEVRIAVAAATPAELAEAAADDAREDPSIFDAIATPGASLHRYPITWALLTDVQHRGDAVVTMAKDMFHRTRPWGADPTIRSCIPVAGKKPTRSYPSGHAMAGWTISLVLAKLLPGQAPAILARARGYARERLVCGQHYPSDIEASHALAAVVVTRLEAEGSLEARLRAARLELASLHPQKSCSSTRR